MTREHQALIDLERMIVFAVVTFKSVLTLDTLLGADEAEIGIAERNAVVGVPSAQHRTRHFTGQAADRRALPYPARRRIADPGLAIRLIHVLDRHPADPVREIMILRRRHCRRQVAQAELFEARQKALLLLTAKNPEYEFSGIGRPAPRHDGQNEAGEISMIELGHAAPFQPLRFARAALPIAHLYSQIDFYWRRAYISRHCDPTGRANARPMAGSAKQARATREDWIA